MEGWAELWFEGPCFLLTGLIGFGAAREAPKFETPCSGGSAECHTCSGAANTLKIMLWSPRWVEPRPSTLSMSSERLPPGDSGLLRWSSGIQTMSAPTRRPIIPQLLVPKLWL